ncbi:MAG: hypothetical protein HPY76_09115 [Anaerolineae bacterium]|nr:hypothetical protein [Anaerolineae bacterium]
MSQTEILAECRQALASFLGEWSEKKGVWVFSSTIAERKAFLSTKRLTYSLRMRVDDSAKVVNFSETLMESGSGLSSGSDFDSGSSGFGFKTETYNTFGGTRKGGIEEQSTLFGKNYSYRFNYQEARMKIQEIAQKFGYTFNYQIPPVK